MHENGSTSMLMQGQQWPSVRPPPRTLIETRRTRWNREKAEMHPEKRTASLFLTQSVLRVVQAQSCQKSAADVQRRIVRQRRTVGV
jgi:hypothetical protein